MQENENWFQNYERSAMPRPEIIIVVREDFGCPPEAKSQERKAVYLYFSAEVRSSGVICCQSRSRFFCAHSLLGLATKAELSQR